jgi:hypothetical protein
MMILELLGGKQIHRMENSLKRPWFEEMEALDKIEAWDLVEFPTGRNRIGRKFVFKKKLNAYGKVDKYKARLVAKGYS